MKFLKNLLAALLGCLLAGGLLLILTFSIIGALAPSEPLITVKSESVLKIDLNSPIKEQTFEDPFDLSSIVESVPGLSTNIPSNSLGILDAVYAIDNAAKDPNIKYILITGCDGGSELAYMEEVRNALERFRQSGKAVIAYGENFSLSGYYIASIADKIYADNLASNNIMGLSTTILYLKDILGRFGVEMQLIRHGKYKSAGEQFIADKMSEANHEQTLSRLTSTWNHLAARMAISRNISIEKFDELVDNLQITTPAQLLENKLIDVICTGAEFNEAICALSGKEEIEDINIISLADYAKATVKPNIKAKDKIAVIYADGQINVAGEGITADKFVPIITKIRKDSSVKAVVLRVNSPGGAVQPAEQIRAELELLRADKPLVVSYGTMAASGGYWISAGSEKIFSNSTTITGSIGVFSMIPAAEKTFEDILHINPETVSTHKHSDMMSLTRRLDNAEKASLQAQIELIYDRFLEIVSEGRGLTTERVDQIAQGRVWTGEEGLRVKLVDEIGGLDDAISYAAICADLDEYRLVEYPKMEDGLTKLMKMSGDAQEALAIVQSPEKMIEQLYNSVKDQQGIYARLPFIILEN